MNREVIEKETKTLAATVGDMAEQCDRDVIECPGCKRRFRRADIKTDRIKCPTCGREVVALVSIGAADSERVIREYFYPHDYWTMRWAFWITGGFEAIGFFYCFFVQFYWSLFFVLLFFGFGTLCMSLSGLKRRKIFKIFERANYDLEAGLAEHRKYMESLGEMAIIDSEIGEDLEKNLRARFSAASKVRTSYAVDSKGAVEAEKGNNVFSNAALHSELPPNECPACHAPYKISDYTGNHVTCRRCGTSVEIKNAVSDTEIEAVARELVVNLTKNETYTQRVVVKMCWFALALSGVFWFFSDSTGSFLRSWAVLPMYGGCVMRIFLVVTGNAHRMRCALLEKKDFSLFDLEFAMKKEVLTDDERREFDVFKGKLLALYKSKGVTLKGKVLS